MEEEVIITGLRVIDFESKDGERVQFLQLYYLGSEEIQPNKGFVPLKENVKDFGIANKITKLPAKVRLKRASRADGKGRPIYYIKDVEYVCPVYLQEEKVGMVVHDRGTG